MSQGILPYTHPVVDGKDSRMEFVEGHTCHRDLACGVRGYLCTAGRSDSSFKTLGNVRGTSFADHSKDSSLDNKEDIHACSCICNTLHTEDSCRDSSSFAAVASRD